MGNRVSLNGAAFLTGRATGGELPNGRLLADQDRRNASLADASRDVDATSWMPTAAGEAR